VLSHVRATPPRQRRPIPLWNRSQSSIAAAEADRQAAAAHEAHVRLQLEQEIAEAEARKSAAREAYDLARHRAEPAAMSALTQLESGYRRGRFTYLDSG
jgi:outer membrane protein TolC